MRVAQFCESFPPVVNGAAVAARTLADALIRLNVDVISYAPQYVGHADASDVRRFPSYAFPGHLDYPLAIPIAPRLRREFAGAGFSAVQTHSPFALGSVGLRWGRSASIPVVTTYHTLYVEYAHYARGLPVGIVRGYLRRRSRDYCNACDRVIVPSEPIRDVLLEYGVRRPIHVVPTGLPIRPPAPRRPEFPRGELGIPEDAVLALYAGRLAREKNLEFLIRAFDMAGARCPAAWLLVAGGGPIEAEIRRFASGLASAARIVFAGNVRPERMPEVYAGSDIFCFASLTDTQGLVLTEAKAAGLPAVAVARYGPATVVRHDEDGLLTGPDLPEFAAALARLLTDSELRARMSHAALHHARECSIERTAEAYLQLYSEVQAGLPPRVVVGGTSSP